MVNEDIHTIWKIWGEGGLIDKFGPDRTIRELKKRCEAGAIIGCSLYKLLIEKWIDVATGAKDQGQRGPAEDFMLAAGEDELVKKIEDLHVQYPNGIPRSIRMDVKDEWDSALEKKVGRRIPLDPKDASKKDIEQSKRIGQELMAKEMPRPLKHLYKPPEKEEKPKPAAPPRAAAPPEIVSMPLTVKAVPELDLMKQEIEDKIAEEKRRRARGGGMAGEKPGRYERVGKKYFETVDEMFREFKNWKYIDFDEWINKTSNIDDLITLREAVHISENLNKNQKESLKTSIEGRIAKIKSGELQVSENKWCLARWGGGMAGEPAGEYPEDNRPLKDRYSDFIKELKSILDNFPSREKMGGMERAITYNKEYNRLKKKYNIPISIPTELILGVGKIPEVHVEVRPESRHEMININFQTKIEQAFSIKELDELMKNILTAKDRDFITDDEYKELMDKAYERLRVFRGGLVEDKTEPSKEERLKAARAIAATALGPVEPTAAVPICPEIPGGYYCPTCKFKYSVSSVISCPYRSEPSSFLKESDDVYSTWTYDDFKTIINRTNNIDDLMDLAKHIEDSRVMTPGDKVSARQLAEKRKRDIIAGTPEIKKQIEQQQREQMEVTAQRLRETNDDDTYARWTYDDFKTIINRTINIDDLMDLAKHIEDSRVMTPGDKVSARQLAEKRKKDIVYRTPEVRRQIDEQEMERKIVDARLIRDDDIKKDDDVMQEPRDYTQWGFADFEGLIPGLEDPEDLEEMREYIDASDNLTELEAENLRNMIKGRIKEVEGGS